MFRRLLRIGLLAATLLIPTLTYAQQTDYSQSCVDTSSTANVITCTPPSGIAGMTAYQKGWTLQVIAKNANTGAVTIQVGNLPVVSLTGANGAALSSGAISVGGSYTIQFDGTEFVLASGGGSLSLPTTLSAQGAFQVTTVACGSVSNCYQVAGDARFTADCATTNLSPTVTSATAAFTSADVGKLLFCINRTNGVAVQRGAVLSVQSATSLTSSANSTATVTGATLELGTDDAPNFHSAYTAAIAANKGISLPCGIFLLDSDNPVFDNSTGTNYSENYSLSGCTQGGTNGTIFILGPDLLDKTGDLVVKQIVLSPDGPFPLWTHGSSFDVSNLQITGLSYLSSSNYNVIEAVRARNVKIYDTNSNNASACNAIGAGFTSASFPGEQNYDRLNIQTTNGGLIGHNCNAVVVQESALPSAAQGDNVISNSVIAYISGFGVQCLTNGSGFACDLNNDYMLNVGSSSGTFTDMFQCGNSSTCNVNGGYYGLSSPATQPFADFSTDATSTINLDKVTISQGGVTSFVFNATGGSIKIRDSILNGLTAADVFSTNVSETFFNEGGNKLSALPTTNLPTFVVTSSEAGTGTCSANAATITFKGTYLAAPLVVISPNTSASTGDQITAATTSTATVHCNGATDAFNFTVTPNPF